MLELSRTISVNLAENKRLGTLLLSSFQVRFSRLGNALFFFFSNCYCDSPKERSMLCDASVKIKRCFSLVGINLKARFKLALILLWTRLSISPIGAAMAN